MTVFAGSGAGVSSENLSSHDAYADMPWVHAANADGMMHLTGSAIRCARMLATQEIERRLLGIRAAVQGADAGPSSPRTDADIEQAIRRAFTRDIFLQNEQLQASVRRGWVTVVGCVPTYFLRAEAGIVLRRQAGVRGVTNSITVEPKQDSACTAHDGIRNALQLQAAREADHIVTCLRNGDLAVCALVRCWAEQRVHAGSHVSGVPAYN